MSRAHDCLIIGAGPAGLTAAIYLPRYHLDVVVAVDAASAILYRRTGPRPPTGALLF